MKDEITILSSQRYLDRETVKKKKKHLGKEKIDKVMIPCSDVGVIDGKHYAIVVDKHHLMEAAKELGLKIVFNIEEDSEKLTGDELLEQRYIDSPYYDIETGIDEF